MNAIIDQLRKDLNDQSDEKVKEASRKFFKEEINSYGIKIPVAKTIGKPHFKALMEKDGSKKAVFEACEILWKSGYMEESIIACEWTYAIRKQFEPADLIIFEKWIAQYVNNWASCDTFCNHTVGALLSQYPEQVSQLKKWAVAENRWLKRAASVSLIVPARKGKFLENLLEIATLQLADTDDLVQKGYGWALKVASQQHEKAVFEFLMKNKTKMPRTALRYAIEKMPEALKVRVMEK